MNIKVIIVWSFGIILCVGIGLFGYYNQDLLKEPVITEPSATYQTLFCNKMVGNKKSVYKYSINEQTGLIDNLNITYTNREHDEEAYELAVSLNKYLKNSIIKGMNNSLLGSKNDFNFIIDINLNEFDEADVVSQEEEFLKLDIILKNINDFEEYKNLVNNLTNSSYNCN